jgi:hypothetical protein
MAEAELASSAVCHDIILATLSVAWPRRMPRSASINHSCWIDACLKGAEPFQT